MLSGSAASTNTATSPSGITAPGIANDQSATTAERMEELREHFGLTGDELNLDLGPLGRLL